MPENHDDERGLPSDEEIAARLRRAAGRENDPAEEEDEELERRMRELGLLDEGSEIELELGSARDPVREERRESEFDVRLRDLETRAEKARQDREEQVRQEERRRNTERDSAQGLGIGLSIAYTILGLPLLGAGIGWLVDRQLDATFWMGMGAFIGAAAGIFMAILMLNRQNRDAS